MRFELIFFLIGLALIILFFPIRVKAKLVYSLFDNKGYLSIYFFKAKIFVCKCKVKKFKLYVSTTKKDFEIDILNEKNRTTFGEIYITQTLKKIKIKNLRLVTRFGFNRDMKVSCLGGAGIKIMFSIFLSIICNKKKIDNYEIKSYIANNTSFINLLTTSVQFNLYCLIASFVKSLILKVKKGLVKKYGN